MMSSRASGYTLEANKKKFVGIVHVALNFYYALEVIALRSADNEAIFEDRVFA
jgi:hypothetical protein